MKNGPFWFLVIVASIGIFYLVRTKPERTITEQLAPLATAVETAMSTMSTPEPTATIGYRATAIAAQEEASTAQAEADAANRIMVQATAQEDARRHEELSWTATADGYARQAAQETAQAAPTYVPATQTQAMIYQGIIATNQSINMTAQAMTLAAPTALIEMARAEQEARLAPLNAWIWVFGLVTVGIFILALSWFLWHSVRQMEREAQRFETELAYQTSAQTVITLHRPDPAYPSIERMVIPCTREQLDALARGLLIEGKSLAFQHWEKKDAPFNRETYSLMRDFLRLNHFALSTGQGNMVLTPEGEQFLRAWLDEGSIPPLYQFLSLSQENTANPIHMSGNHAHETVGEGFLPIKSMNR